MNDRDECPFPELDTLMIPKDALVKDAPFSIKEKFYIQKTIMIRLRIPKRIGKWLLKKRKGIT